MRATLYAAELCALVAFFERVVVWQEFGARVPPESRWSVQHSFERDFSHVAVAYAASLVPPEVDPPEMRRADAARFVDDERETFEDLLFAVFPLLVTPRHYPAERRPARRREISEFLSRLDSILAPIRGSGPEFAYPDWERIDDLLCLKVRFNLADTWKSPFQNERAIWNAVVNHVKYMANKPYTAEEQRLIDASVEAYRASQAGAGEEEEGGYE